MSLLAGLTPAVKKHPCKVRTLLETLEPEDVKIFEEALANEMLWPTRTLALALNERKVTISDVSIGRHRKGQCSCA